MGFSSKQEQLNDSANCLSSRIGSWNTDVSVEVPGLPNRHREIPIERVAYFIHMYFLREVIVAAG